MRKIVWKPIAFTIMILMLAMSLAMTGCGKAAQTENGQGEPAEEAEKAKPSVADTCYILIGMSADGEEYNEEMVKDLFGVKEVSEYISVYFAADGRAFVKSMLYGEEVIEGTWKQVGGRVSVDLGDLDWLDFDMTDDGALQTVMDSDDDEFLLTLNKTEDFPEGLAEKKDEAVEAEQ